MFIEKMLKSMTNRLEARQGYLDIKIDVKEARIAELKSEIKSHYSESSRNEKILNVLREDKITC